MCSRSTSIFSCLLFAIKHFQNYFYTSVHGWLYLNITLISSFSRTHWNEAEKNLFDKTLEILLNEKLARTAHKEVSKLFYVKYVFAHYEHAIRNISHEVSFCFITKKC